MGQPGGNSSLVTGLPAVVRPTLENSAYETVLEWLMVSAATLSVPPEAPEAPEAPPECSKPMAQGDLFKQFTISVPFVPATPLSPVESTSPKWRVVAVTGQDLLNLKDS
jgi:hypothetical protein